jgi:hypothetical protein
VLLLASHLVGLMSYTACCGCSFLSPMPACAVHALFVLMFI